jgi:hypothetical protein
MIRNEPTTLFIVKVESWTSVKTDALFGSAGGFSNKTAYEVLEPYEWKLSSTVLRGERSRKAPDLPGWSTNWNE